MKLAEMAQREPVTSGLLINGAAGDTRRNPLVTIASNAADDMIRYAGEFGLTPVAR